VRRFIGIISSWFVSKWVQLLPDTRLGNPDFFLISGKETKWHRLPEKSVMDFREKYHCKFYFMF
jgi:hypothetical protein